MNIENLKAGEEIFYAGSFYEVAEIAKFPHGKMIGIFDETKLNHIDYLNPSIVKEVYPCQACQGGGCPTCSGYGRFVGS